MTKYNSEDEFLKNYNLANYEKLSMTSDIVLLSISSAQSYNYRKTDLKRMSVLLVKRNDYPYKDKWTLPGGFLNPNNETLEECAKRVLLNETNVSDIYLEQLYTFDSIDRDPRMRVVSCSYVGLVDKNRLKSKVKNAYWFDIIKISENNNIVNVVLQGNDEVIEFKIKKELRKYSTDRYDFKTIENNYLAFDHDKVILSAIERIRNKINYTDIVFNMMPNLFTLGELQQVYEVILNKKLLDPAFRRIIKDKVVKTERMKTGEGHRPSYLYRYKYGNKKN